MITFFRNIRKSLLGAGQARRYLLYAIGEIALVVIGILIALQINNWNEDRKLRNLEQSYLKALQKEFTVNLERVNKIIETSERSLKNANLLIGLTGPGNPSIKNEHFSELFFSATLAELKYRPSTGVLKEIISSGRLAILKSEELRGKLASWESLLEAVTFQEDVEHGRVRQKLIDYSIEKGNWRKIIVDRMPGRFKFDQTKFKLNNVQILQSEKFENLLVGFIVTGQFLNTGYYVPLEEEIESILGAINDNLINR